MDERPLCAKCNKEPVALRIGLGNTGLHTSFTLFCKQCFEEEEKIEEPDHCLKCGKKITTQKEIIKDRDIKKIDELGICGHCKECYNKKVQEALEKGMCSMCFEKPRANAPDKGGSQSQFCFDCAISWSKMLEVINLNTKLARKRYMRTHD